MFSLDQSHETKNLLKLTMSLQLFLSFLLIIFHKPLRVHIAHTL